MFDRSNKKEVGNDGHRRCPECREFDCVSVQKEKYDGKNIYWLECTCGEVWDDNCGLDDLWEDFDKLDRSGDNDEYCPVCGAEKYTVHPRNTRNEYQCKLANDYCKTCRWISPRWMVQK